MKKLIPILAVVILAGGYAGYTFAMPHKKPPVPKVNGTIYILPKQFTLNLQGGQYATVTVALLLAPTQSVGATDPSNPPPTGFGSLPEEAVVRAIITNAMTDQPTSALLTSAGRAKLQSNILHMIKTQTDDVITKIYLTDIAVQ
jgi:flagellar basal body-associated protein FliL